MTNDADLNDLAVLHVTEVALGGVVGYLDELLSLQVQSGLRRIDLLTPDINVPMLSHIDSSRFTIHSVSYNRRSVAFYLIFAIKFVRLIHQLKPEVVHVHSTLAGLIARTCGPLLPRSTSVVYCAHGWAFSREGGSLRNGAIAAAERALARATDRIICISEAEKRDALKAGLPDEKLTVVLNGISPRGSVSEIIRKNDQLHLLFVGRFDRQKGFDIFIEVVKALSPDIKATAIGAFIVSAPEEYAIPAGLKVLGWQDRRTLSHFYEEADVLIVPSRWEGFGLVALEAMERSRAVFASSVGGLEELVVDGKTGALVPSSNSAAIVERLLATDAEQLKEYGRAGRARYLKLFTAERMARDIEAVYAQARRKPDSR